MAGTFVSDTIQNGAGATVPTTTVINGSAKAWIAYNGTAQTILSSFNVSSVTYVGAGNYTINFTTAFANTNYATVIGGVPTGAAYTYAYIQGSPARTTSSVTVAQGSAGVALYDTAYICVAVYA